MEEEKEERTLEDMHEELLEINRDNEFMKKQMDLFASFLWRHQRKERKQSWQRLGSSVSTSSIAEEASELPSIGTFESQTLRGRGCKKKRIRRNDGGRT